jgi:hypothetical protein
MAEEEEFNPLLEDLHTEVSQVFLFFKFFRVIFFSLYVINNVNYKRINVTEHRTDGSR